MKTKRFDYLKSVLWVDSSLIVVNKPPGLLTISDGYDPSIPNLKKILEQKFNPLFVIHRLDRDTSGVILFARTSEAHSSLSYQFQNREISKTYHALVIGKPVWVDFLVDYPLLPDGDRKHRTIIHTGKGKSAATLLSVLQSFREFTLIEAKPHTGYTHQIRAHLAAIGCPIVADPLYGNGKPVFLSDIKRGYKRSGENEPPLIDRTALHALSIRFLHPQSNEQQEFTAEYPKDLNAVVYQLKKN